jgi:hypothetical protein
MLLEIQANLIVHYIPTMYSQTLTHHIMKRFEDLKEWNIVLLVWLSHKETNPTQEYLWIEEISRLKEEKET